MKDAQGHGSDGRGGAVVRLDSANSPARKTGYLVGPTPKYGENPNAARTAEGGKLSSAAGERIAMRQDADERHYPPTTITDRMAANALGQAHPKSYISPLGSSFQAAQDQLDRARNVAVPRGTPGRRK